MADDFEDLEADAERFLGDNPDHGAAGLIRQLRQAAKRAEERGRKAAQAEFAQQAAREKAFAKIPEPLRPLFDGIDPTDQAAVTTKLDALKALGLKVEADAPEGQQQAPAQQQQATQRPQNAADLAVQQMQQAAAGAITPGQAGDLATRMQAMALNPEKYTQDQIDAIGLEFNQAVEAAARQGTSGALG